MYTVLYSLVVSTVVCRGVGAHPLLSGGQRAVQLGACKQAVDHNRAEEQGRRAARRTCAPPTAENKNPPCPEYAPLHVACRTVRLQPLPSDAFGGKRCEHAAAVNAPEAEFLPMEIKVFSREGGSQTTKF